MCCSMAENESYVMVLAWLKKELPWRVKNICTVQGEHHEIPMNAIFWGTNTWKLQNRTIITIHIKMINVYLSPHRDTLWIKIIEYILYTRTYSILRTIQRTSRCSLFLYGRFIISTKQGQSQYIIEVRQRQRSSSLFLGG